MGMSYIGPSKITRNPPDAFISFGLVFTRKSVSSPPVVVAQGMRKRCAVPLRTRWMVRSSQAPTGWPVGWVKWVSNWLGFCAETDIELGIFFDICRCICIHIHTHVVI